MLPGPTGERNVYSIVARTQVLCLASTARDRLLQLAAVLAVGSRAVWPADAWELFEGLPATVRRQVLIAKDWTSSAVAFDAVLLHRSVEELAQVQRILSGREGAVISVERLDSG